MKTFRVMLIAVLFLLPCIGAAQGMRMTPEERANRLKDSLALSDSQYAKVKAIYEENQKTVQTLFEKNQGDRDAMFAEMSKVRAKTDSTIELLLNKKQKARYEEMKKNRPQFGGPGR